MKYVITINQREIMDSGLFDGTDLIDWVIIDFLTEWQRVPDLQRTTIGDKTFVWIDLNTLIYNLPIIRINRKERISIRLSNLETKGLIERTYDRSGRLFVRVTHLPESQPIDPRVKLTVLEEDSIINNTINTDNPLTQESIPLPETQKGKRFNPLKRFSELAEAAKRQDLIPIYTEWVEHLRDRKTPVKSTKAVELHFKDLAGFTDPADVVNRCIKLDYRGLFDNSIKPKKKKEVGDAF